VHQLDNKVFDFCRYLILPVPHTNYSTDKPPKQAMLYAIYGGVTVLNHSKYVVTDFQFFCRCTDKLTVQTWRGLEIRFAHFIVLVKNLDYCYLY